VADFGAGRLRSNNGLGRWQQASRTVLRGGTPISTSVKIAVAAEVTFAIMLGLFALPGAFDGDAAPVKLQAGFLGYALFATVVAVSLGRRPRAAAIAGMIFALIYLVPGTISLASSTLWEATSNGLARSMLLRFGGALAAQYIALGALCASGSGGNEQERAWIAPRQRPNPQMQPMAGQASCPLGQQAPSGCKERRFVRARA
jgi:hypothetical protein